MFWRGFRLGSNPLTLNALSCSLPVYIIIFIFFWGGGQVQWIPEVGKRRITSMVEGRSDWCISRQRSWGVPIPAFYHVESGDVRQQETPNCAMAHGMLDDAS